MATEDKLVTNSFLLAEIANRKTMDTRLADYSGQPETSGEPDAVAPTYTDVTDITQGISLTDAVSALAAEKNSKITVYQSDGTTSQGDNPRGIHITKNALAETSLTLAAEKIVLNLSQTSVEEFVRDVTPSYGSFGVIGASITFVRSLSVTKEKVTIF